VIESGTRVIRKRGQRRDAPFGSDKHRIDVAPVVRLFQSNMISSDTDMLASDSKSDYITQQMTGTLHPVFMGCATKKCQSYHHCPHLSQTPHRLGAPLPSLRSRPSPKQMNNCMSQGVDKQFKNLKTLLSLITN
jgi:hypothetical protein